jgi:hypothetical protein
VISGSLSLWERVRERVFDEVSSYALTPALSQREREL